MHKVTLTKPDGRNLCLYAKEPLVDSFEATSPNLDPTPPAPHFRWHPMLGEWVAYASYRQSRVFLPPREYNPFSVTRSKAAPTELPPGTYDVAVFDNLSPVLSLRAPAPLPSIVPTEPALGACEVIVFSQDPETSLGKLPLWHLELLFEVWADRYVELGARPEIQYVMPFEHRGVEVGVTLHHPHGQLYAYPFVPPIPARELEQQRRYFEEHRRGLLQTLLEKEIDDGRRILYLGRDAVAFMPAFARYPYEAWIAPLRPAPSVAELTALERHDLSRALKTVLLKYDGLWKRPFPYLMTFRQAPTDGRPHPEAHFHLEFWPPYRARDRLKYLAGTELAAGLFANDALPEEKADELKEVEVHLG